MNEIGLEKARAAIGEIVERARLAHEPTTITRHGKPAAVVVNADWHTRAVEDLWNFKPEPMSQNCRDGKHCGTGDDRCLGCYCLCHWHEDPAGMAAYVARVAAARTEWIAKENVR